MSENRPYCDLAGELSLHWTKFLPGIDRLLFVTGEGYHSDWAAFEWKRKGKGYEKNEIGISEEIYRHLQKIREQKDGFRWITKQQIPFYIAQESSNAKQLTITNENKYLILVIIISVPGRALSDLFYLFFRDDKSNFGISHDSSPIDTSQKSIIGMMALNFAADIYKTIFEKNREIDNIRNIANDLLRKKHYEIVDAEIQKQNKALCVGILSEISERNGVNYVYQGNALEMLTGKALSYKDIKMVIEDAVSKANVLNTPTDSPETILESFYFDFTDVNTSNDGKMYDGKDNEVIDRMQKAYKLLDNLEQAAQKLLEQEEKLTGKRVGDMMETPVSAPAITDALKKHRSRILILLNKYPGKWTYIRSHFKPVLNLYKNNGTDQMKAV